MTENKTLDKDWIFYNPEQMPDISADFFSSAYWQKQEKITGSSVGRGTTWFFKYHHHEFVLRHYLRGGLIGKFNRDHYLFTGNKTSRSWLEFELLQKLNDLHLPAPLPAAGRVVRSGLMYRADLIIERIPNSRDLVHILRKNPINDELWQNVGHTIAQFHQANVNHADLNAHNILIDDANKVWLIDFDRGQIHSPNQSEKARKHWQQSNIQRLHRSFVKELGKNSVFHWQEDNWQQLMKGYKAGLQASL